MRSIAPVVLVLITVHFLVNLSVCFAQDLFQENVGLSIGNCHLRIISWSTGLEDSFSESLNNAHHSLTAVFSIKPNPTIKKGFHLGTVMDQSDYKLFLHPRLALIYYFLMKTNDIQRLDLSTRIFNETKAIYLVIQTVFIYILPSESNAAHEYRNAMIGRNFSTKYESCPTVSYFKVNEAVPPLNNRDPACLQIQMKVLFRDHSQTVTVLTDIPVRYVNAESKVCVPKQIKLVDRSVVMLAGTACILTTIEKPYNITYLTSKKAETPESELKTPILRTTLDLLKRAVPKIGGVNLQLIESPLFYEPFAFLTTKANIKGFESGLTGAIDVMMWVILAIVFVCMRISVVVSLSATASLSQKRNWFKLKLLLVSFMSTGIYKKLRVQAAVWKNSKCLLANKLVWALGMSTLVSYAYKAGLTSFLTHTREPIYPTDLDTLISECNRQVGCVYSSKGTSGQTKYILDKTPSLKQVLRFYKPLQIFRNFLLNQIRIIHKSEYGSQEHSAPKALLYTLKTVDFTRGCIGLFLPDKKVSASVLLNYRSFAPFYVSRSYFYEFIKKRLNRVYESGLYDHWQRNIERKFSMYMLSGLSREIRSLFKEMRVFNEKEKWLMYLLGGRQNSKGSRSKALSFSDLRSVWILYSMLLTSICAILLLEMCIMY